MTSPQETATKKKTNYVRNKLLPFEVRSSDEPHQFRKHNELILRHSKSQNYQLKNELYSSTQWKHIATILLKFIGITQKKPRIVVLPQRLTTMPQDIMNFHF